ncbi:site-specific DNA-methyltransferase [Vitiosangium sp. GDMCC 1.1324]|nr:site-specific DNA-methyltransferase [Vitiosangium sp. GDMCC 1.1324]
MPPPRPAPPLRRALKLGRRYVGIDMDAQYLELSKKRLVEAERTARR